MLFYGALYTWNGQNSITILILPRRIVWAKSFKNILRKNINKNWI